MPTEEFNFRLIDPVAEKKFYNHAGTPTHRKPEALVAISDCLVDGGWTITDQIYAKTTVFINATIPVIDPDEEELEEKSESTSVFWYAGSTSPLPPQSTTGIKVYGYNPNTQFPPPGPSFQYDTTTEGSISNALGGLFETGYFGSVVSMTPGPGLSRYYELQMSEPGPDKNNILTNGDALGNFTVGDVSHGGGYKLLSQAYRGTQVELELIEEHLDAATLSGRLKLTFEIVGKAGKVSQPVSTWNFDTYFTAFRGFAEYKLHMVANPYQFAIWNDKGAETAGGGGSTSLLCSIPWRPEDSELEICAILIGSYIASTNLSYGSLRNSLVYKICYGGLDGPFVLLAEDAIGMAMTRYPGEWGLKTTTFKAIAQTCYVGVRAQWATTEEQRIVGCLWAASIISDKYLVSDSNAIFSDYTWTHVGSQIGSFGKTQGSLWLAAGQQESS